MPNQTTVEVMVYASDREVQRYVDKKCIPILPFQLKLKDCKQTARNVHLKLSYCRNGLELRFIDDDNMVHKVEVNLKELEMGKEKQKEKESTSANASE